MAEVIKVKPASPAQTKTFGIMKPTMTVQVSKQKLQSKGVLHLENYADDLDKYESDFVLVGNIPVVVQRYASNAKNEYTVLVDSAKATGEGKDPWKVSDDLLTALGVERDKVVWENEELRQLLRTKPAAVISKRGAAKTLVGKKSLSAKVKAKVGISSTTRLISKVSATTAKSPASSVSAKRAATTKKAVAAKRAPKKSTVPATGVSAAKLG